MIGKLRCRWQWPVCLLLMVLGLGSLLVDQFGGIARGQIPGPTCCQNCQNTFFNNTSSVSTDSPGFQDALTEYSYCVAQCGGQCPAPIASCNGTPYSYPTLYCCGATLYAPQPGVGCCGGLPYNSKRL